MPRLFVAIDLPGELKARLSALRTAALPARWVEPEKLHLTLCFIGEVDESGAKAIDAALRRIDASGFSLTLKGIGHFHRQTLWAGVESCPPLISLRAKIEDAIRRAGLPVETRRYVPHVKLARLRWSARRPLRAFLNEHALFAAEPFDVAQFSLYDSHLSKEGAVHRLRAAYALRPVQQGAADARANAGDR